MNLLPTIGSAFVPAMQRLAEAQPAFDDLFENCWNTREVTKQASIVSGIDLVIQGAPDGPECSVVFYKSPACAAAVEEVLHALLATDVRSADIVVLTPVTLMNSCLAGMSYLAGTAFIDVSASPGGAGILFSTMHGFKGLEPSTWTALVTPTSQGFIMRMFPEQRQC